MGEEPRLPDEMTKKMHKHFGWTKEQIENLSPKMVKFITTGGLTRAREYKIMAEVMKSENCMLGLKTGDRYIITAGGVVLADECTANLCLWALGPLLPFLYMVWDRVGEGLDPNGLFPDHVKCADTGVECGGWGEVLFRISCSKGAMPPLGELLRRRYIARSE